jgi:hypothetical protein
LGKGAPKKQRCSRSSFTMLGQSTQSWWANIYIYPTSFHMKLAKNSTATLMHHRGLWIRSKRGVNKSFQKGVVNNYWSGQSPNCSHWWLCFFSQILPLVSGNYKTSHGVFLLNYMLFVRQVAVLNSII